VKEPQKLVEFEKINDLLAAFLHRKVSTDQPPVKKIGGKEREGTLQADRLSATLLKGGQDL